MRGPFRNALGAGLVVVTGLLCGLAMAVGGIVIAIDELRHPREDLQ